MLVFDSGGSGSSGEPGHNVISIDDTTHKTVLKKSVASLGKNAMADSRAAKVIHAE
jgi:hypothetical protein